MDTEERDRTLRYLSYLHTELQLGPWQIVLSPEHTPDGEDDVKAMASVDIADGRWIAVVRLSRHWSLYNDRERTDSLVHEMLHLLTHELYRAARQWAMHDRSGAGAMSAGLALIQLDEEEELLVDRLTTLIGVGLKPYGTASSVTVPNVRAQDGWC